MSRNSRLIQQDISIVFLNFFQQVMMEQVLLWELVELCREFNDVISYGTSVSILIDMLSLLLS